MLRLLRAAYRPPAQRTVCPLIFATQQCALLYCAWQQVTADVPSVLLVPGAQRVQCADYSQQGQAGVDGHSDGGCKPLVKMSATTTVALSIKKLLSLTPTLRDRAIQSLHANTKSVLPITSMPLLMGEEPPCLSGPGMCVASNKSPIVCKET
jgi:hypothetical protein